MFTERRGSGPELTKACGVSAGATRMSPLAGLERLVADGEGRLPFQDDERLGVGWRCGPGPSPGFVWRMKNETGASWAAPSKQYEFPLSGRLSIRTTLTAGRMTRLRQVRSQPSTRGSIAPSVIVHAASSSRATE